MKALLRVGIGMLRQRRGGKGEEERRRVIKRVDVRSTSTWHSVALHAAQQSGRDNDSKERCRVSPATSDVVGRRCHKQAESRSETPSTCRRLRRRKLSDIPT